MKGQDQYSEALARHATWVQQRQRAALYLDILSRGGTREQARKALTRALYDWKTPIGDKDLKGLAHFFTFFQFYRLSFGQMLSAAARGDWRSLSRVRRMEQMMDLPREVIDSYMDRGEERAGTPAEAEDAFRSDTLAWWDTGSRATFFSGPTPEYVRREYARRGMSRYGHMQFMSPPATPLDSLNTIVTVASALTAWLLPNIGEEEFPYRPSKTLLQEGLISPLSALLVPGGGRAFELALASVSGAPAFRGGGIKYLNEGEERLAAAAWRLGITVPVRRIPGEHRPFVSQEYYKRLMLMRILPFVGTQMPRYASAIGNPYWQGGFDKGFATMMLRLIGQGPRGLDVESGRKYGVKSARDQIANQLQGLVGINSQTYYEALLLEDDERLKKEEEEQQNILEQQLKESE